MNGSETIVGGGPSPSERLRVLGAWISPGPGGWVLSAVAEGVVDRAAPFEARVGDQWAREVMVSPEGFSGYLTHPPNPGERLFVRYMDTPEVRTDIVFQGPSVS